MFTKSNKKTKDTDVKTVVEQTGSDIKNIHDTDRLFEQFLSNRWLSPFSWHFPEFHATDKLTAIRVPQIDIIEDTTQITLKAEIPGVEKDDITVTLGDNTATIQGKVHKEEKEDKGEYHYKEISTGSFSRTVALPGEIDTKNTKAVFVNGVLTITLPKTGKEHRHSVKVE